MTESNWHAFCLTCGEFVGPAHIDQDGGGGFYRTDRCLCACPRDQARIEIIPLGAAPSTPKK
jgi:hypothetical protein